MESKEIKQYVAQGYLRVHIIFEIVGNPKDYVSKAMADVMKKIAENKGVIIISQEIGEAEDAGEGMWGTFCEAEMLIKDIRVLSWVSFNFVPASIEIIEPAKLMIKDKEMTDFMGDIIAQLHDVNKRVVAANSSNMSMLKAVNALMRNAVLISLNQEEKTAAELAKKVGVQTNDIDPLLEAMIKEKTIEKKGTKYKALAKK